MTWEVNGKEDLVAGWERQVILHCKFRAKDKKQGDVGLTSKG